MLSPNATKGALQAPSGGLYCSHRVCGVMLKAYRVLIGVLVLAGAWFTTGCSDTRLVTSKRDELSPRVDAIIAARKTAASFDGRTVTTPTIAPVVSDAAPNDESNTLVIEDKDIDELDVETSPQRGPGAYWEASFAVGNECAKNAANVLKFGHFPDDGPHAGAGVCVAWLLRLAYVLVVHVDKKSRPSDEVDVFASGSAVLVDVASNKALGKLTFDESSKGSAMAVIWTKTGQKGSIVTQKATPTVLLMRKALSDKLEKLFPNAKVAGYRPK